jgi:hypothetical protein
MLTNYLPLHPEIKAYLWFNWPVEQGGGRFDWPIESSAPAQQRFRKGIQGSLFRAGPVALPNLTKVPPPPVATDDPARPEDISSAAEMVSGADVDVAPDGTSTFVWSAQAGGEFSVFARRVHADGDREAVQQLAEAGGDALAPQVAVAPDGTAVVTWTRWDPVPETHTFRIQERRLTPEGAPEEATRTLSGPGQDAVAPQVDVAPTGEATVVWQRRDGFHYLAQVGRIAPDGTIKGSAQRLSEQGEDAVEPQVAVAADGTATAVWSRYDGEDSIVQTRRVSPEGTLAPAPTDLSAPGQSAVEPRVAVAADGSATAAWNRFDGSNWVIQGRRITPTGEPAAATTNHSAGGRDAAEPQLAVGPGGAATIVWDRFDGTSFVVQARRLDGSGDPVSGLNLSATGRDAAGPQVAISPSGVATVLWTRHDGSNWLVQRRDIDAAGALGATTTLSAAGRSAGDPSLAWGGDGTLSMSWRRFAGNGDVVEVNSVPKPPPPPPPTGSGTDAGSGSAGSGGGAGSGDQATPSATTFRVAGIRLNRKRGTAAITVEVPGPGTLAIGGAIAQQRRVEAAGNVVLRVLPDRKARRLLARQGSARVKLVLTFVPAAAAPSSRALSLRLKKTRSG